MKNIVDELRKKLTWFTYDASYSEYNEQEVNYIIDQLQNYDKKNEDIINSASVSFRINKGPGVERPKKKLNVRTTMAFITMATIAATFLAMILQNTEAIAGLRSGIFNFLSKDDSGTTMIIEPEYTSNAKIYNSLKDIPEELQDIIWIPTNTLDKYTFSYVIEEPDKMIQRYNNKKQSNYVEVGYILSSEMPNYDGKITMQMQYGNVSILYFTIDSDNAETKYRRAFHYNDTNYYIESDSVEDVNVAIYEFIDYIVSKG